MKKKKKTPLSLASFARSRMLGNELIVIFHYEGDFQFDMFHPLYKGGKQKMRSIPSDITFQSLVKVAHEASHWEVKCEDISIHYLHHNGKVFSLVGIENDNDIKCMLTLSIVETNGIFLYINRTPVGSGLGIGEQPRSHGLNTRMLRDGKCAGTAGSHDAKRKAQSEKDTRCFTVNLSKDDDMHFSSSPNIATDELAQESDIFSRKSLDAVESDEVEAINIEDNNPRSRTHGGALNTTTVGAKSNVTEPSTHVAQPSIHMREIIFEDTVVPKESHPGSRTHGGSVNRATVNAKSNVSEFMHAPNDSHMTAVKRILRFLKGTIKYGLLFRLGPFSLQAHFLSKPFVMLIGLVLHLTAALLLAFVSFSSLIQYLGALKSSPLWLDHPLTLNIAVQLKPLLRSQDSIAGNTQYGVGGNNPQVHGNIGAATRGNINLGSQGRGASDISLGNQGNYDKSNFHIHAPNYNYFFGDQRGSEFNLEELLRNLASVQLQNSMM